MPFTQVEGPEILPDNSEVISQEIIDNAINKIIHLINKSDDIAAIYVELVQLSNGVCILPKEYVKRIYEICKEKQILFVTDEVATGFGRTGKMFAAQHYGVWPDIMTIGKGMSAGTFPIAGVAVTEDVFNAFCELHNEAIKLEHGYTTAGHPVGCAAVLATIEEIERCNFVERSREMGQYMLEKLHTLFGKKQCHELIDNIRGIGLMVSINFKHVGIRFSNSQEATRGIARVLYYNFPNL